MEENEILTPPYLIPEDERLNSNIYKNIFPEEVMDMSFVNEKMQNAVTSYDEIRQDNHGFMVNDILYKDSNGVYGLAIADGTEKSAVAGIVTKVTNSNIFTIMNVGIYQYGYLPYKDTTVMYLSDILPGKFAHYLDIYNKTYIPVAIYIDGRMILNIQNGSSGTLLEPYGEKTVSSFEAYKLDELNEIIEKVWDSA